MGWFPITILPLVASWSGAEARRGPYHATETPTRPPRHRQTAKTLGLGSLAKLGCPGDPTVSLGSLAKLRCPGDPTAHALRNCLSTSA